MGSSKQSLIQPLTDAKVNDIWRAGFCEETVEHARLTEASDSALRIRFLTEHVKTCKNCRNANILKTIEHETAKSIGPDAEAHFAQGGDITVFDAFKSVFQQHLESIVKSGVVNPEFFAWIRSIATRKDQSYTDYLRQKDLSP